MKKSLLLFLCLSFGLASQAQEYEHECGSSIQDVNGRYENNPEVLKALQKEQKAFNEYVLNKNNSTSSFAKMSADSVDKVVRRIPVVFHVLYDKVQAANISTAELEAQLVTLNEDFRRQNATAVNTPEPFKFTADSNLIAFSFDNISDLVGLDKYLSIQAGPTDMEDFEFNIPSGNKLVIHFTNDDFGNAPIITPTNGETITIQAIDVQNLTTTEQVRDAVKAVIDDNFSSFVTTAIDTNYTSTSGEEIKSITVRNLQNGEAVTELNNISSTVSNIVQRETGRYIAADSRIEFVLAKLDPDGNPTTGINRIYSDRSNMANYGENTPEGVANYNKWRNNMKSVKQWDPTKYFNIWTVQNIPIRGNGTLLGFAQFPFELEYNVETDGVVLGMNYTGGGARTLSHEVGHWLNLIHIWGDDDGTNGGGNITDPVPDAALEQVLEGTDNVYDTPNQGNRTANNCPDFIEVGEAGTLYGDMFMNYMDYSNDQCMSLFTFGQVERMRAAMDVYRTVLFSEENLMATGVSDNFDASTLKPAINFSVSDKFVCENKSVSLRSETKNTDASSTYTWSFPGSSVADVTGATASISFPNAGTYNVQLDVTNANGTTSKMMYDAIYVAPSSAVITAPAFIDFTSYSEVVGSNSNVTALSHDNEGGWKYAAGYGNPNDGADGATGGLRIATYKNDESEVQTLIFKPMDNSGLGDNPTISFDFATVKRSPSSDDRFELYGRGSDECGSDDWRKIYVSSSSPSVQNKVVTEGMAGNDGQIQYLDFVPTADDWQTVEVPLIGNRYTKEFVEFRIELFGKKGNYFYLDNFNVSNAPLSIEDNEFESSFSVVPNPSNGNAIVEFELGNTSNVTLEIVDIIGKSYGAVSEGLSEGKNQIQISNVAGDLTNGIYFAKISNNNRVYTQKFVVSK